MRIVVNLTEDSADVLSEYSAGAKVYLLSASSESGSYTDVTSTAIVSGQEQYELTDAAGTSATWYKSQVGNSAGSTRSALSAAFQATAWDAYATIDDLRSIGNYGSDTSKNAALSELLIDQSRTLDQKCARTFLRVPQVSGTVTVYFDIANPGCRSLVSAIGHPYTTDGRAIDIVSVTSLWCRESETSAYVSLGTQDTDWFLDAGYGPGVAGTDWPFEDITLSAENSTRTTWATGKRAGKAILALGFPRIPAAVRRGVMAQSHERWRQGPQGGATAGTTVMGAPVFNIGDAPAWRELIMPGSPFLKRMWRS